MKNILLATLFVLLGLLGNSQELRCEVELLAPQLKNDPENTQVLEQLKKTVLNFMNNTKWTSEVFKEHEKIETSILITISERSGDAFTAKIQVTSRRPVFNTNYTSTVVNTLDGAFNFTFQLNAPILFTQGAYTNNLSSVLAFYAYYVIGMDYDTYSLEGGTKYLLKAQEIANLAQSSGQLGWSSNESVNNRYWIIENILNVQFKGMRKCSYEYHRLGLDLAHDEAKNGVDNITKSLSYLEQVHVNKPGSVNMRLFFVAKVNEILNIYSEASNLNKQTVFNIVRRLDPSNIQKYQKMLR
jgi:hypothetical protein